MLELYVGGIGSSLATNFLIEGTMFLTPLTIFPLLSGVNDDANEGSTRSMEKLIRGILSYSTEPAVILASTFKLINGPLAGGADAHAGLAHYYDVPMIDMRNWLLPLILKNTALIKEYFREVPQEGVPDGAPDRLHPTKAGHEMFAQFIIAYLEQQLCIFRARQAAEASRSAGPSIWTKVEPSDSRWKGGLETSEIPALRMDNWFPVNASIKHFATGKPTCNSADDKDHPLTYLAEQSQGVGLWADPKWHGEKVYLQMDGITNHSKVALPFETYGDESVELLYMKSAKMRLGAVLCHVDDRDHSDAKIYLDGHWDLPT